MNRLAVTVTLVLILAAACGPDNPFEPDNPSYSALTAVLSEASTAKLSWTMCPDSDFLSYTLYRSGVSGISNNPDDAVIITVIDKNTTTTWYDENISGTYYYALKTSNESGGTSWSNEVSVKTAVLRGLLQRLHVLVYAAGSHNEPVF